MPRILPRQIRHNAFDAKTLKIITGILQNIPEEYFAKKLTDKILGDIMQFSSQIFSTPQEMMWVVAIDPAYFIQYKKDSSAVFLVSGVTVIAYKPKFLEYPQIVDMAAVDQLKEGEAEVAKVTVVEKGQGISATLPGVFTDYLKKYYQKFYPTAVNSDSFQTVNTQSLKRSNINFALDFIKQVKYYLSKYSGKIYWHCILGSSKTQISHFESMANRMKISIDVGQGQPKVLHVFSLQGINNPISTYLTSSYHHFYLFFVSILKDKWKQALTFLMLFILLMTIVMCPATQDPESSSNAICAKKSTIFYTIGGLFMIMMGMRLSSRKKPKGLKKN